MRSHDAPEQVSLRGQTSGDLMSNGSSPGNLRNGNGRVKRDVTSVLVQLQLMLWWGRPHLGSQTLVARISGSSYGVGNHNFGKAQYQSQR